MTTTQPTHNVISTVFRPADQDKEAGESFIGTIDVRIDGMLIGTVEVSEQIFQYQGTVPTPADRKFHLVGAGVKIGNDWRSSSRSGFAASMVRNYPKSVDA